MNTDSSCEIMSPAGYSDAPKEIPMADNSSEPFPCRIPVELRPTTLENLAVALWSGSERMAGGQSIYHVEP
ncbi:hypothetical protein SBA4_530029 [Candidatus Sulfopaludibacter sp. SbA4]|nr:hypothetical protein SBA4_530029 [Candidatus Sulfopaludibacter sp. SbA4]